VVATDVFPAQDAGVAVVQREEDRPSGGLRIRDAGPVVAAALDVHEVVVASALELDAVLMVACAWNRVRAGGVEYARYVYVLRAGVHTRLEGVGDATDADQVLHNDQVDRGRAVTGAAGAQLDPVLPDRSSDAPGLDDPDRERTVLRERLGAEPERVGDGNRRADHAVAVVVDRPPVKVVVDGAAS